MQAMLALHDNQVHVAESLLEAHLKQDPFDARAIRMLAGLARQIGRYKDAKALLQRRSNLRQASPRPANCKGVRHVIHNST